MPPHSTHAAAQEPFPPQAPPHFAHAAAALTNNNVTAPRPLDPTATFPDDNSFAPRRKSESAAFVGPHGRLFPDDNSLSSRGAPLANATGSAVLVGSFEAFQDHSIDVARGFDAVASQQGSSAPPSNNGVVPARRLPRQPR